jgi:hypothetical protein
MTVSNNRPATSVVGNTPAPAVTTPVAPAVATPAAPLVDPTAGNPAGVDPNVASNLGTPATPGSLPVGIPGLARFAANTATLPPQPFDLVPGRVPDAVGLPMLLDKLGSSPQGQAAVKQLLGQFEAKTGVKIPEAMVAASMAQPTRVLQAMQLTPAQLSAGMAGINTARANGAAVPEDKPAKQLLPQKFDLSKAGSLNVERPQAELKEIAPGILQGDIVSSLPDAQAKSNMITAEVFSRLAANASAPADKKFTAVYGGHSFTSLDRFLDALSKDGHQVSVRVDQRVANFSNLKTKAPDGTILDVPAPLMVRTGVKDAAGREAVVPAAHAELVISIHSGPNTKGPAINADVKYYQGISGTGFFPVGLWKDPTWCGKNSSAPMEAKQGLNAVKLAGVLTDVINQTAQKNHLFMGGYGVTGVCNDSVAVIQTAATGSTTLYPLLMKDEVVLPELQRRLTDKNRGDDGEVKSLIAAVNAAPTDVTTNASTKARAQASLPWAAGAEPFESSVHARATLAAQ